MAAATRSSPEWAASERMPRLPLLMPTTLFISINAVIGNGALTKTGNGTMTLATSNNNYTGYNLPFPHGGTWYEILNSQALDYLGNGWGNGGSVYAGGTGPYIASVTIPQMGLLVFRLEDPSGRSADLDYDGNVDLRDFAVFQQSFAQRGCGLAVQHRDLVAVGPHASNSASPRRVDPA